MVSTNVFWKWWFWSFVVITVVVIVILFAVITFGGVSGKFFWLLSLLPVIFLYWMWSNRLIVQPEWNHIYTWNGEKMEPLTPGVYYLFPSFGFLTEVAEVPMNIQTLFIYSGLREWVSEKDRAEYAYGADSNFEPEVGSSLGLMYKVQIKCLDPNKLFFNQPDSYSYIAGIIELEISKYVHKKKVEGVIKKFQTENWNAKLFPVISAGILDHVGVQLISFVAGDIILNPESEKSRANTEILERNAETDAKVQVIKEEGQKKVLEAKLVNMGIQKNISQKADEIRTEKIIAIKNAAGVNGVVALNFVNNDKKLDTILESSKKGNITYVDDSKGSLSQASAMAFAIKATNP